MVFGKCGGKVGRRWGGGGWCLLGLWRGELCLQEGQEWQAALQARVGLLSKAASILCLFQDLSFPLPNFLFRRPLGEIIYTGAGREFGDILEPGSTCWSCGGPHCKITRDGRCRLELKWVMIVIRIGKLNFRQYWFNENVFLNFKWEYSLTCE